MDNQSKKIAVSKLSQPISELIEMTQLPEEPLGNWLSEEVKARGLDLEKIEIQDLRGLLADILQDLILSSESQN